jgi:hypothetical protein
VSKSDEILVGLLRNGAMTADELVDAHPKMKKDAIMNTVYQLKHQGLADRVRDDVTGMPAYRLTAAGRAKAEKAAPAQPPAPDDGGSSGAAEAGAAPGCAVPSFLGDPVAPALGPAIETAMGSVADRLTLAAQIYDAGLAMPEAGHDPVEHPKHYTSHPSGIECIQVTEHMGFNLGNAVKYIWRADLKADAIEDLRKARWYIERELVKRGAA